MVLTAATVALTAVCVGCGPSMTADSERRVPEPSTIEPTTPITPVTPTETPPADGTEPTAAPAPTAPGLGLRIYLVRDEKVGVAARQVPKTAQVAQAAMRELLAGPSASERSWGFSTTIPAGTRLNGVTVRDGLATVDLSPEFERGGGSLSMQLRAAQVVFTLTQFRSVNRVAFRIDGKPLRMLGGEGLILDPPTTRSDYPDVTPAILVEGPTPGSLISSPLRTWGTSNTFEGTVQLRIVGPNGTNLVQRHFQSKGGMGIWGPFDVTTAYAPAVAGEGEVVLYEDSARDGSDINVVRVPVRFE